MHGENEELICSVGRGHSDALRHHDFPCHRGHTFFHFFGRSRGCSTASLRCRGTCSPKFRNTTAKTVNKRADFGT
eukprot:7105184-Pyramimonas_sp.AAC.1